MSDIQIGGLPLIPPPINNACLPNIYDKLNADAVERSRVRNKFVDCRLQFYEKMIEKHRKEALRLYVNEKNKISADVKRILRKTPYLNDIPYLEAKVKLNNFYRKDSKSSQFKAYSTEPKELNGIPAEKDSKPYCNRFFEHHLPRKPKFLRQKQLPPLRSLEAEEEFQSPISRGLLLSKRLSISENCITSRAGREGYRLTALNKPMVLPEDDAMTI